MFLERDEGVFLQPGDVRFGDARLRFRTLLGSCVAATVWHPGLKIGGMCHFLLPSRGAPRGARDLDGRYGDEAFALLARAIREKRASPSAFEVKLFGGGVMFRPEAEAGPSCSDLLQDRNISVASEQVKAHGFTLKAQHLGGHGHRYVIFDVGSGDVWVKHTPLPGAEDLPAWSIHSSRSPFVTIT